MSLLLWAKYRELIFLPVCAYLTQFWNNYKLFIMLLIKTNWDSSTEMGAKGTKGILVYAEMYVPDEYS